MGKKLLVTPNGKIRQALRLIWLRSRERSAALKRTGYCCEKCGKKQTKAKGHELALVVHHKRPVEWDGLFDDIRKRLLHDPKDLMPLCNECHDKEHKENTEGPAHQG